MVLLDPALAVTIVPQPPPPGLYVTMGPELLVGWALEKLTQTVAHPATLLWVDGANAFNAYLVALAARAVSKDPVLALRAFQVARPFTAYQLEAMICEKALPAARRSRALLVVIADPLRLFAEAEGRDTQIKHCHGRFILGLRALAQEMAVLVLSPTGSSSPYREALLREATRMTHLHSLYNRPSLSIISYRQAVALG